MYTEWDEYFIHQTPDTIDHMVGTEKEWFDYAFIMGVPKSDLGLPAFATAVGCYPNTNVMQASALVVCDGIQYNLRASRELDHDRANLEVGPLSYVVIDPLHRWKLQLKENPYIPVSFEIEFRGRTAPRMSKALESVQESWTGVAQTWSNMCQSVSYAGNISVVDKDYDIKGYVGMRDRSWGIRTMRMGIFMWNWIHATFKDYDILVIYQETADGDVMHIDGAIMWANGDRIPIVEVRAQLAFESGTREYTLAEYEIIDATGKQRLLTAKRLSRGIYAGGSWSGEGWWEYKGPLHVEGEKWDLNDQQMLVNLGKMVRHSPSQFTCDGDIGYGFLEYGVSKRHVKYGPTL